MDPRFSHQLKNKQTAISESHFAQHKQHPQSKHIHILDVLTHSYFLVLRGRPHDAPGAQKEQNPQENTTTGCVATWESREGLTREGSEDEESYGGKVFFKYLGGWGKNTFQMSMFNNAREF